MRSALRALALVAALLPAGGGAGHAQGNSAPPSLPAGDSAPPSPEPAAIEVGVGTVRFSGLVQAWYVGGTDGVTSTFRVRRAELKFGGEISSRTRWTVMADLAKTLTVNQSYVTVDGERVVTDGSVNQASRLLQDAYVTLALGRVTIDAGQHKLPLGLEGGAISPAKLDVVERALFMTDRSRGGGIADVRDLGVTARATPLRGTDLQVGVFNGSGESMGTVDRNDGKALVTRVVHRLPVVPGLQLGASSVWAAESDGAPRKDRLGGELLYARGPLKLQAEVMGARDGALRRRGYYLHAGWKLGRLEPVVRYDVWDPDTRAHESAATAGGRDYLLGFNYAVDGTAVKLQANAVRRTIPGFAEPRHLLLVNLQTAW